MDLPSKHVLYLAKRIGSRGAGSDGEAAAASYILHAFRDFDLEVDMETFSTWRSDWTGLMLLYVVIAIAYLLFRVSYTLSAVISIAVFLVFQVESYTWAVASRLMPRKSCSNIVARVLPSSSVKEKVVIVANYDSARSSPLGRPRMARLYRLLYFFSFLSICIIMVVCLAGTIASLTKVSRDAIMLLWSFTGPFPLYLLVFALLIGIGESRGRYTAGANDNASGVGAMLSVIAELSDNPLEHTEVWGVATARGMAGGRGMVEFLHRHRHTLRHAYIISLDHCGVGNTKFMTREGPMFGFRCSWKLRSLFTAAARRSRGLELEKGRCRVKKGDALVALVRGYRAITIGGVSHGTYPGWRNADDTLDTLERKSMDRAVKLVNLVLEDIDQARPKREAGPRKLEEKEEELEAEETATFWEPAGSASGDEAAEEESSAAGDEPVRPRRSARHRGRPSRRRRTGEYGNDEDVVEPGLPGLNGQS